MFHFVAPTSGTATISADPVGTWGAVLVVRDKSCTNAELGCATGAAAAPAKLAITTTTGTQYFIFVGKYSGAVGSYVLSVAY